MLPKEFEMLGADPCCLGLLRVSVVLQDMALEKRHYVGKWHMFLPSEMSRPWLFRLGLLVFLHLKFLRFAAMYQYDPQLFKMRFLGEDGVPLSSNHVLDLFVGT